MNKVFNILSSLVMSVALIPVLVALAFRCGSWAAFKSEIKEVFEEVEMELASKIPT